MNLSIETGAYGWRHKHWLHAFYPEDLPVSELDDWRLSYYSNEFNVVLVPAHYWCDGQMPDCEAWHDEVHNDFRFIIECHRSMLERRSEVELIHQLKMLRPKLSGLVFLDSESALDESLIRVKAAVEVEQFESVPVNKMTELEIWQQKNTSSGLAMLTHELTDLRRVRAITESFIQEQNFPDNETLALIINHPDLKAENLNKFSSVLKIMGY